MTKKTIRGAGGGGGGGGHTPVEAPNTLRSNTVARCLFLLSEGEIGGLADQANKLKAVSFNNTPVMNSDGSMNFTGAQLDERYGLPSQPIMKGYPSASSSYTIATRVTTAAPYAYTTTTANVDAVRVTIRFPALYSQASNGDVNGAAVTFKIYKKLGSGSYVLDRTVTKNDKCISASDVDYLVERPAGTGVWTVQVVRVTADSSSTDLANDIYFQAAIELQYAQLSYNDSAYIGLTVTAQTTGSSFPTVAFDVYGIKIQVPSNYNVLTRAYTGLWDGTFQTSRHVCDNPAWVLYDMLTNTRYGMGIDPANIDQYSFYDAAVYCDQLVPALVNGVVTGTEPRYTFNYQFMEQAEPWAMVQNVAAAFGSVLYTAGNKVKLVQDRPVAWSRLITNSNVIDGVFDYMSSTDISRTSAAIVYWNNPAENFLSVPAYYEDSAAVALYGLNRKEVTGLGITSEGQAVRLAKWLVDTSINNTDTVTFKVGLSNAGIMPGEVIKLMDTNWAETMQEAKVVSYNGSRVTLDRPVNVTKFGTFDVVGADGVTLYTETIQNNTGTVTTINYTGTPLNVRPGADVIITGAISPRLFKVTCVKEDSTGIFLVSAVQYDPNKFSRVDNTPSGSIPVYQNLPSMTVVSPVTGITFSQQSYIDNEGNPKRYLAVQWTPPAGQFVTNYQVFWNKDNGTVTDLGLLVQPNCRIPVDYDGLYSVTVYAFNSRNVKSAAATGSISVNLSAPLSASPLAPVTGLQVVGGGTTFSGTDCNVVWTDSNTVANSGGAVVAGYEVKILDASTPSIVYRTDFVNLADGRSYTYDLTKQKTDNGANLKRSFIVQIRVQDTWGRFSAATAVTFSNPVPAAVSGLTVSPSFKNNFLTWNASSDPDIQGYIVWRDTTAGFTVSSANQIFDGLADSFTDSGLADSTTYYYKIAAYDVFGKSYSGTGLNVVASGATTTLSSSVQNEYQLTGVVWTPNSPATNQVSWSACTAVKTQGASQGTTWSIAAGSATWTAGILYIYYTEGNTTLQSTTTLSTAIAANKVVVASYRGGTNLEHGDGRAYTDGSMIIAGTVGASQLVVGSAVITQGAQIANAIIDNSKITNLDAGKITTGYLDVANRIAANSIVASQINSNGLSIKDTAGNVILAAGSSLAGSTLNIPGTVNNTPSGWLNSNISISGGAITGIGSGSGTAVDNAMVPIGTNLVPNSDFSSPLSGSWTILQDTGTLGSYGIDLSGWYPNGGHAIYFQNTSATGACRAGLMSGSNWIKFAVAPGEWYELSAYVGSHRNASLVRAAFYTDASLSTNVGVLDTTSTNTDTGGAGGGATLAGYARLWGKGQVPAGASVAILWIQGGVRTSGTDCFTFATQVFFGRCAANQTSSTATPWSPAPARMPSQFGAVGWDNQITASNASTYIANAAIGSAQVGTLTAGNIDTRNLTIKDASGNIIFGSGASVNPASYMSVPSGWQNSNITLSGSAGTISINGAGGGSATGVVMPGNPITSGNITTYISGAAIGTAQIQNASITNALIGTAAVQTANIADGNITTAKIGNLQVDTLQIANNAVTVCTNATGSNSALISATVTVPAGATVVVMVSANMILNVPAGSTSGSSTVPNVTYTIKRDTTTLFSSATIFNSGPQSSLLLDTPGAGTFTYYFDTVTYSAGGGSVTINAKQLVLQINKK